MSPADAHIEADAYAKGSPFYTLDPRVKLVGTIALIVAVAVLTSLEAVAVAAVFVLALALASRVPLSHLGRNFVLALVFILFASITMYFYRGWESALLIGLRISVCVLALLLMITTTPFFKMLRAMRALRIPKLLASLTMFTYRFIYLLLDEMERMRMARKARGFKGGRSLLDRHAFRTISNTIGMTFVRANVRAGNIYDALLLRGYSGEVRGFDSLHARPRDAAFATYLVAAVFITLMFEMGVLRWTL